MDLNQYINILDGVIVIIVFIVLLSAGPAAIREKSREVQRERTWMWWGFGFYPFK